MLNSSPKYTGISKGNENLDLREIYKFLYLGEIQCELQKITLTTVF